MTQLIAGSLDLKMQHQAPTSAPDDLLGLTVQVGLKRVGREMRMLVENANDQTAADPSLLKIIARAHHIRARLIHNTKLTMHDIAREERVSAAYIYLALKSVHALRDELADAEIKSKRRMRPDGAEYGAQTLSRGALYLILQNRLYRGEIPHKGNSYPGEQPAIVNKPLWDEVQAVLAANRVDRATGACSKAGRRAMRRRWRPAPLPQRRTGRSELA